MYIAGSQEQTTPGDNILMSTETSCHFGHFLQVSKISLKSDFILLYIFFFFFFFFIHVYSHRAGADNPNGDDILVSTGTSCHSGNVASFKNISLKSDFIPFFS